MTQARRSRPNARRPSAEPRVPAWVWLFTGCVLGAFIMFLVRLSELKPDAGAKTPSKTSQSKTKAKSKSAEPRFDFYDILKENQVTQPETTEQQSASKQTPAEPQEYILQVASFKNANDAEQLKVELLLLNMEAYIEQVKLRNGETWHRVLVGPFTSRSKREKVRNTLVANHYEALVLKRASTE